MTIRCAVATGRSAWRAISETVSEAETVPKARRIRMARVRTDSPDVDLAITDPLLEAKSAIADGP
ncbi:hypothetical protein GCM10009603_50990 [Nocardiopsis exhalans]